MHKKYDEWHGGRCSNCLDFYSCDLLGCPKGVYKEKKMDKVETRFYSFSQNNSGGSFDINEKAGISIYVIVEAIDSVHANVRAEQIGLDFDGFGDCSCCGNRWTKTYMDAGDPVLSEYSEPIVDRDPKYFRDWTKGGIYYFVHYLNGKVEGYDFKGKLISIK